MCLLIGQASSGPALMQKQKNSHQVSLRSDSISLSLNLHVIANYINSTNQRWPQRCDSGTIIMVYTLHLWNARNHFMEKKFLQIALESFKIKFIWWPDLRCVHWENLFCFFQSLCDLGFHLCLLPYPSVLSPAPGFSPNLRILLPHGHISGISFLFSKHAIFYPEMS